MGDPLFLKVLFSTRDFVDTSCHYKSLFLTRDFEDTNFSSLKFANLSLKLCEMFAELAAFLKMQCLQTFSNKEIFMLFFAIYFKL